MSFLNRMMVSVGIGAAKVDTRLENARVRAGDDLRGVVRVVGGSVPQQVSQICLHLMTQYRRKVDDRQVLETVTVDRFRVGDPFTIGPGDVREFPFQYRLPDDMPVTVGRTKVWLKTGLDVPAAVDPKDQDTLQVLPHRYVQVVLDALDRLGFRIRNAECEQSRRMGGRLPFIQEYEFVPAASPFRGRLDELEAVFFPHRSGLDVYFEIDRRARGLMGFLEEALDADERHIRVEFRPEHLAMDTNRVAGYLEQIIRRYA